MKNPISTLLLLFFISPFCLAGNLSIQILQKGAGDPVVDATVVLGQSGEFGMTDEFGRVQFDDVELPIELKVLAAGYETLFHTVSATETEVKLYLTPVMVESQGLEVVADRVEEKTSKVILDREELRKAPGSQGDPLKVIQSLPGVVTAQEGRGIMYIRGSEPNQNIVWVNRARIGYLYHFGGLYSTISPQLVRDFNMFLGGFPVEYGDALGGALDVKLRAPKNDRLHQNYSLGTYEMNAMLEGPLARKRARDSFYVAGRRSYVDLIFDPNTFSKNFLGEEEDEEFKDSVTEVPEFYDFQAVWQRTLKNGRFLLQQFIARDRIRLVLNSSRATDPETQGELASSNEYHSTSAVWEQQWSRRLYSVSSLYFIYDKTKLKIGEDANGQPFFLDIYGRNLVWQPEIQWQHHTDLFFSGGTEFLYANTPVEAYIGRPPGFDDLEYNFTETQKFRINRTYQAALVNPYVKARKTWNKKLDTQLGLRYAFIKSNAREDLGGFSPRASFEYRLTKRTRFTGVWGRYLQLPDETRWIEDAGNPRLKYLEAQHRILGLKHQLDPLWTAQIEAYHKPMKHLVTTYDENPPPDNYQSDGTGEAYGFDVLIKRNYAQGKMGWLSYSYLKSERRAKGKTFPFDGDQRHTLILVWSQPLAGNWKRWNLGFRLQAHSGRPYTRLLGRTAVCQANGSFSPCADQANAEQDTGFSHWSPQWGAKNAARLPNFYQLDVRADREFLFNTWKMNIYLDILNILNIRNISGYDYGNALENFAKPEKKYSMGLFPSFGIEVTL